MKKVVEKLLEKFEYVSLLASDCQGQQVTVSIGILYGEKRGELNGLPKLDKKHP